jgi:hypothetical protein
MGQRLRAGRPHHRSCRGFVAARCETCGVRLQTIGKRIGRDPVALLIAAYVATTVVLLWLAVSDARMLPHDDGELTFGHRIGFHPQVVPPEPWAVPAAIGLLLIALVLAAIWTVRRR